MLLQNAIQTPDGTILVSTRVHDYKSYKDTVADKYYSVDGGLEYRRISCEGPYIDLSVFSNDDFSHIRTCLVRGSSGKSFDQPFKWVRLMDMSNAWLEALILWIEENQPENKYKEYYLKEIEYRKENNIIIQEEDEQ